MFCGSPNTTSEHLFSRWTHKFMEPRRKGKIVSHRGGLYVDRRDLRTVKLPGQVRDWQIRCVCGGTHLTCNGGWMKRVEDKARPVLIPLIEGKTTRLSQQGQVTVATWAALKAMVSEYDYGGPFTHHMQRKRMMKRQLPPEHGWTVWIGRLDRVEWKPEFLSSPFLVLADKMFQSRSNIDPTYFNSNATTQVIGKLFIQVIHSRMRNLVEEWRFATPDGGSLFRIWPTSDFSIAWPGRPLTDRDAEAVATAIPTFVLTVARRRLASSP